MKFLVILTALGCSGSSIVATSDAALVSDVASAPDDASPVDTSERAEAAVGVVDVLETTDAADAQADLPELPTVPLPEFPCPLVTGEPACTAEGEVGTTDGATNVAVFEGAYTCAPVVLEPSPCPLGSCDLGSCATASDEPPPDVEWFLVQVLSFDPACCFDLSGDGIVDNTLATSFIGALLSVGKGPDEFSDVTDPIRKGHLLLGIGLRRGPDPMLWIARLDRRVEPEVPLYPAPANLVLKFRPSALVPGTLTPRTRVALTPSGDGWEGLTHRAVLELVTGSLGLPLQFRDLRVKVTPVTDGLRVEIGGLLRLDDAAQDLNRLYLEHCGCWHEGPILGLSESSPAALTSFSVPLEPAPACERPTGSWAGTNCKDMAQLALPGLVDGLIIPDVDANDDGTLDSLTAGLWLTAVPIGGVLPP